MTAILTCESDNLDTITEMVTEAKRMGFRILPPDVNESFSDFTVVVEDGTVTDKIRFGLGSIKNMPPVSRASRTCSYGPNPLG